MVACHRYHAPTILTTAIRHYVSQGSSQGGNWPILHDRTLQPAMSHVAALHVVDDAHRWQKRTVNLRKRTCSLLLIQYDGRTHRDPSHDHDPLALLRYRPLSPHHLNPTFLSASHCQASSTPPPNNNHVDHNHPT